MLEACHPISVGSYMFHFLEVRLELFEESKAILNLLDQSKQCSIDHVQNNQFNTKHPLVTKIVLGPCRCCIHSQGNRELFPLETNRVNPRIIS